MVDVIYPKLTLHFVDYLDHSIFKVVSVGGFTYMCRITYTVKVASRSFSEANKSGECTQLARQGRNWPKLQYPSVKENHHGCFTNTSGSVQWY